MENRRFLDTDAIAEILNDSASDISNSSILEENTEFENTESSDSETDSEEDVAAASTVDPLFIAKNKMQWSAVPLPCSIGTRSENIISIQPGPTRFAVSRCQDILSSFLLFFPPPLEKIIIENTNMYGRVKFEGKWKDIDEATLRAYIAVLILAGVCRYVYLYRFFILVQ